MQKLYQVLLKASLFLGMTFVSGPFACAEGDAIADSGDTVLARVLEFSGRVTVKRIDQKTVTTGLILTFKDTLDLAEESRLTLLLHDGTISEYEGPCRISTLSHPSSQPASVLAKLGAALSNIFFSSGAVEDEATLGVRDPGVSQALPLRVPRMMYPPSGIGLIFPPAKLHWQPIEGVIFYKVSIYGRNELVWDGRTNSSYIDFPQSDSILRPGNDYLWVVEAELGDSSLRSQQASFSVLDKTDASRIKEYVEQIDEEVADERLRHYLKAELYRNHDLKLECYDEVVEILKISPKDYSARIMQAQLLEEMSFLEEAIKVYKSLID